MSGGSDLLAEVAARYGATVAPGARVMQVPRGVSGLPVPVWNEDKRSLLYPDGAGRAFALPSRSRSPRPVAEAAPAERPRRPRAPRAPQGPGAGVAARMERVLALRAGGKGPVAIAAALHLPIHIVNADLGRLRRAGALRGLVPLPGGGNRPGPLRDAVRERALAGLGRGAIAAALAVSVDMVDWHLRRLRAQGLLPPPDAAARKTLSRAQVNARRDRVAALLAEGQTRERIARALRAGLRTIDRDVAALLAAGRVAPGPTRSQRRLALQARIEALHGDGVGIPAIAREVGLTRQSVRLRLLRAGVIVPVSQPAIQARRDAIARHRAAGASARGIAAALGLSLKAVWRELAILGGAA